MTAICSDTSGKTTTPMTHSCSNHCVIQVGPLGSDAMFEVVEISDACVFSYLKCQDNLYTKNYENWLKFVKVMPKILAVLSFIILTNLYFRISKVSQQRN